MCNGDDNNDKVRELVEAFRLIPIADPNARDQLHESLKKILTPAAHKIPETQKKITEFEFTEPEFSYHDIAERQKYRPMKHGIHYLDEDSTLYYNSEIEASAWRPRNGSSSSTSKNRRRKEIARTVRLKFCSTISTSPLHKCS